MRKVTCFFANVRKVIAPGIVCILLFTAVSCERSPKEGKEVPFTRFPLSGTSCRWIVSAQCGIHWSDIDWDNPYLGGFPEHLTIINSNEKLENYIWCGNNTFPSIDFSNYTLLLVRGTAANTVSPENFDIVFFQTETGKYTLKVNARLGLGAAETPWGTGILTPKLPDDTNITLEVRYI